MTHIEDRWVIRARELLSSHPLDGGVESALVLGQEMADARAEYIALKIDQRVNRSECIRNAYDEAIVCAEIARGTIEKQRTREDVLEHALKGILCVRDGGQNEPLSLACQIARRALAWKPHTERTPRPD